MEDLLRLRLHLQEQRLRVVELRLQLAGAVNMLNALDK